MIGSRWEDLITTSLQIVLDWTIILYTRTLKNQRSIQYTTLGTSGINTNFVFTCWYWALRQISKQASDLAHQRSYFLEQLQTSWSPFRLSWAHLDYLQTKVAYQSKIKLRVKRENAGSLSLTWRGIYTSVFNFAVKGIMGLIQSLHARHL